MAGAVGFKDRVLQDYLRTFFRYSKYRAVLAVAVMVAVGLTEGVGLLMLIPFLQLIGIGDSAPSGIVALVGTVWTGIGLPLNLPAVLAVYAVIVSLYALSQRASTLLNSKVAHAFTRGLRVELFESMARVKWLNFTRIKASDINHVMTTNLNVIDNGTYSLFVLISSAFIVVVHVGVALTLSVPLTLVALGSSAVLLLVLRPLNKQSYRLGEQWRETMGALFGVLMEHLSGMKLAKSFAAEGRHIRSFSSLSRGLEDHANRFAGILSATQMYYEIGAAVVLGLFFYVALEVLQLPAARILIMVFLFGRLVPQFSWMQRTWQNLLNMLPAYGAILDMMDKFRAAQETVPKEKVDPVTLERGIEFREVSFRYDKDEARGILNKLDLFIPAMQTTIIVGPSGGGKSTFADLLIGLLTPDEGEILIDGRPLVGDMIHSWRRSVAYVPQESLLFHDAIRDNLLWAKEDATEEDLRTALRLAAADDFIARLPEGLDTVVGDRGVRLSGGERQRIALARALLRKPTLLLLDEATSNLDQASERRILQALEGLRGSMTVAFISHRMSAARCADRVLVLDGGKVVESGTVTELSAKTDGLFRQMLWTEGRENQG